jgi:DNA repair exonuclease SbcCD ATPase subunit
VLAEATERLTQ